MRQLYLAVAVLLTASTLFATNSSYVVPTTTLAAQTSNNTSAANTFTTLPNGDLGAGNVSKADVHTLLYSGATTKIYAHMVLWFGEPNHMNIGYNSTDPTEVANQINDMVSRGIDGVILDWYGPGNFMDQAALQIMTQAEAHPGFTFAIMIDQGAIEWYSCAGCSPQQALVNDLQYVESTYFPSPAYMTMEGKPVITQFNVNLSYPSVSWNAALAGMGVQPILIFQNNSGFTADLTGGSYSWVMPTASDYGLPYLTSFYQTGMGYPSVETIGATYKGFNDTLASWGSDRIMSQQCGQTWLQTFSEINGLYNSGKPLPYMQIVTWNDYEEATEIESGIDNCFSLTSSLSSNSLQWAISGNENTVDYYTAYISTDGQNLMPLTNVAAGVHSLNLCGFPIPSGNYQLFVQAVGMPSFSNHITAAVNYSPSCASTVSSAPLPPPPATATVSFSASPNTVSVPSGKAVTVTVTAAMKSGILNAPIALSCGGLPPTLSCSFSPNSITPGTGSATSTLTISTVAVRRMSSAQERSRGPIYASWILSFGIIGFIFVGSAPGRGRIQALAIVALIGIGMVGASCGGGTGPQSGVVKSAVGSNAVHTPVNYPITIDGDASSTRLSATVNVIVQ